MAKLATKLLTGALLASTALSVDNKIIQDYSFSSPFSNGTYSFSFLFFLLLSLLFLLGRKWAYGGNSIVTPECIRITPDSKSMSGYIFNTRVKYIYIFDIIHFYKSIFTLFVAYIHFFKKIIN